ncbi:hypothetical protein [Nonomuraea guangzhouensis]|uniref:Uncharacterized protein n=1 Tax=Nonomuraea guangzhouensis TaxID=1291555 RepID=A0ABW4GD78_9ACTN|nr:hypothetical protein [Nonomuraea guangzhouensis]
MHIVTVVMSIRLGLLLVLMAGAIVSRVRVADSAAAISVDVLVLALVIALVTVRPLA